jgi:RNA polymerase sigma-70 factor (ECF subfamily)
MPLDIDIQENVLIEKCKNGESEAFGMLINGYRRQLYSYLFKLSGDRTSAEDLFQETLIKVWKGIKKYKEQNKFSSWLFSIAHNVSLDAYRKRVVRSNIIHTDELPDKETNKDPLSEVEAKELKEIINKTADQLPDKQKHVFLLRQHGGLTFKEISELTDEPLNTVLGHMHYATKKIRTALRKENVV